MAHAGWKGSLGLLLSCPLPLSLSHSLCLSHTGIRRDDSGARGIQEQPQDGGGQQLVSGSRRQLHRLQQPRLLCQPGARVCVCVCVCVHVEEAQPGWSTRPAWAIKVPSFNQACLGNQVPSFGAACPHTRTLARVLTHTYTHTHPHPRALTHVPSHTYPQTSRVGLHVILGGLREMQCVSLGAALGVKLLKTLLVITFPKS